MCSTLCSPRIAERCSKRIAISAIAIVAHCAARLARAVSFSSQWIFAATVVPFIDRSTGSKRGLKVRSESGVCVTCARERV